MNREQQYRELQYIWSRATECLGQNRHALAIRLLKEGIELAESSSYNDPSRLYQMKRDLAGAYADLGAYKEAIRLYQEAGRFDFVGHLLLMLGRTAEATTAYRKAIEHQHLELNYKLARALFMVGRYEEALDTYVEGSNNLVFEEAISRLGKTDCMLALAGLQVRYGFERLKRERKRLEKEYKRVYRAIVKRYGNWRSALVQLRANTEAGKPQTLAKKLRPKRDVLKAVDLQYEENEVVSVLALARSGNQRWERLISILRLAQKGDLEETRQQVRALCLEDPNSHISSYGKDFYRDLLIVEARFYEALAWHREDFPASNWNWNKYLNLLLLSGERLKGEDLATHYAWLVDRATSFLAEHKEEFVSFCEKQLAGFEMQEGIDLLRWIARKYGHRHKGTWGLFCGAGSMAAGIIQGSLFAPYERGMIYFYAIPEMQDVIRSLLTGAEDRIRENLGLPRIGEGWISESEMVRLLRERLAPHPVVSQASPVWLGGLRYDAYVPNLRLAVEYQGKQHFEPVDFFGGERGFRTTRERDRLKARLSEINGVRIEYIRYDEDLEERVSQIIMGYDNKSKVNTDNNRELNTSSR